MEETCLHEVLLMEDHERVMVARIRQEADVTLIAIQLRTGHDFRQVVPRFLDHARQAELVGGFTVAAAIIVAAVNMDDILCIDGQGP
jgi:hypothetical protein